METPVFSCLRLCVAGLVRIEVFPERDGNLWRLKLLRGNLFAVRIEVFPERDGNVGTLEFNTEGPCVRSE